ncbi:hypothetical protein [Viridibacillus arvi]|uniref:hypothetical protein n=1 Tax=Viridibacillus arvi TaxID=263475 RepID=UPI0034CDC896
MPYIKPIEEKAILNIIDENKNVLFSGDIFNVREWIEEKLEDKIDIFVSLQEYFEIDDLEYSIAVHSDAYEDCSEEEISKLTDLNINDSEEPTTKEIYNLLKITVQFSHYKEN